ncbi:glycosyltransferase family protein [Nocardia stercoris]|nr:glycosyltransferase [Nocardia stercoris]
MTSQPRTVALYWHNGRSLGHTASTVKVARYLLRSSDPYSIAGITGAYHGLDLLPADVDLVKIPSFTNRDDPDGWHLRPRLAISEAELHRVRSDLITVFLRCFRPEVLMSDHIPRGADDELVPSLEGRYAQHAVLTLRGVLFDRDKTMRKYFGDHGRGPWLADNYCQFNVHCDPAVFDLADYYGLPGSMSERLHYTGYLAEPYKEPRLECRARLGVTPDERLIVAAMGGGQGAGELWRSLSTALNRNRSRFDRAVLVTGPYLEPADRRALRQLWKHDSGVAVRTYEPDLMPWMKAADLFVGAAGANMLGEVLATGVNAIAIPRQVREVEQNVHAERLHALGLVRRVGLSRALDGALDHVVATAIDDPLDFDGTRFLWDGGSYDRHLPGGSHGTRCACTLSTTAASVSA